MDHVEELCDELIILNEGKTLLQGNLRQIIDTYEIDGRTQNSVNDIFIHAASLVENS